ncbi:hypothetical protein [Pseudomonas putida]|uniref:hypothetical protein n=1 Tax=Pseudomonas TaxID=286 RepID=UPI00159DC672|nr:hypothetical protein [Pseudomonas putida]NVN65898.1 hypothetical protein [Pseudomonas putida]NVN71041.1 hypothetical protein [Pseudomonas putida]
MKPLTFSTQQHDRTTKARRKYLKLQDAPDKTAPLPVTAPNVQGIIDSDDGTLHKDRLKTDLTVEIPAWSDLPPGSDPNDYSTLQLQFTLTGAENTFRAIGPVEKFLPPLVPGDFPLALAFPQASIPRNGKLWIRYELVDHKGDQYVSHPIELICDSVPPWGDEPAPPLTAPTDIINEAYLTNHQAGIELGIPEYPERASKDTYQAFYLKEWPEENADYDNPVVDGTVTDDRKITIPADVVRNLGDGRFYIVYYLFDKAQNRSRIRLPATVDVVLTPEPKDLLPPEVPLAVDDGVLSLKDAQAGVQVEIQAYTNSRKEDKIAIKWGATPLIAEQVGSRPFPISISVPSDILRNEYGKASGEVATPVSYQVLRGHAAYGPAADDFAVDFSVAGPERPDPDPDWPDPVNDKMLAPTITSFSGDTNLIPPADRGKDATLTFKVFEGAAAPQVVDFYWDGTQVTPARWVVDEAPGADKSVTIPWSYIEAAGNKLALPVHYTVRGDENALNEQESLPQFVEVSAIDMTADDLEFLGLTDRLWLSCQSLWDPDDPSAAPAIRVQVPPCSRFNVPPNTTMTLNWVVYDQIVDGNLIDGVEKTWTVTLNAEQIANGFVTRVEPYDQHIKPIYDAAPSGGRAEVSYVINTQPPITSNTTTNKISVADQGTGGSCDVSQP